MTRQFFSDIFEYNKSVNDGLAERVSSYGINAPKNTLRWMSHIFNAHHIWNNRILGIPLAYGVWQLHPMPAWSKVNHKNHDKTTAILEGYELSDSVSYTTTEGVKYSNKIYEVLYHIVNHSTYHRGQIAIELREKGFEPFPSDYIFYKRT